MTNAPATFLHRISYESAASEALLAANYLPVGHGQLGAAAYLADADDWTAFETVYRETYSGAIDRQRHQLWRYLVGMQRRSRVVVPRRGSLDVYEIIGEVALPRAQWPAELEALVASSAGEDVDLGYVWHVKLVESSIDRATHITDDVRRRLKFRGTTADISDLSEAVEQGIQNKRNNVTVGLSQSTVDHLVELLAKAFDSGLSDIAFEELIERYFRAIGADQDPEATKVYSKRDKYGGTEKSGDIDVIATFSRLRTKYVVQAKKHSAKTDATAVAQIRSYLRSPEAEGFRQEIDKEDFAFTLVPWVISTGDGFSPDAIKSAALGLGTDSQDMIRVHLIDGKAFARMLLEAGVGVL